jgi:hypothetical protein
LGQNVDQEAADELGNVECHGLVSAGPVGRAMGAARYGGTGVERGGIEFGVPQEGLDHADVDILFEQVRGEAVPERMRRHAVPDPAMWAATCTARLS